MFAVIYSPDFGLQAALRLHSVATGAAVALLEERGRKAVVTQVSASAGRAGVMLGMTAPQALARCGQVRLLQRSPAAETMAREALLAAAFSFSPRVEETAEGICTIDLKGVTEGPKEEGSLVRRGETIVAALAELGLVATFGLGANPLLALLAARVAQPVLAVDDSRAFLARLPLRLAEPPERLVEILEQWGVRTCGALTQLSREEVANRLGPEGTALWDRAAGREERVLRLAALPEVFEEYLELEHEVETLEPLLFLLRRFIGQLCLRLGAIYRVAEEVRLEIGLSDGSKHERSFRLPEPTREAERIFRMLHTHLEGVRTEFGIVAVRLWFKPCRPVAKQQDFFEAAVRDPTVFADTLARLVAVAGSGNVGSPRLEPTHRPDAVRMEALEDARPLGESAAKAPPATLPLRRFRPAVPARVELEETVPAFVESSVMKGRIRKTSGPWRLSGHWWDERRWTREEWDVELAAGGLYRLVREREGWFVEGGYG